MRFFSVHNREWYMVSKVARARPTSNVFCVQLPCIKTKFVCGIENLTRMVFTLFMLLFRFGQYISADVSDVWSILGYMVSTNVLSKY